MTNRSLLIVLLLLPMVLAAQENPWTSWEAEVVRELNTASDVFYLNEEEKKVILFMNMARHDGALFAQTFLTTYVEENNLSNSTYLRSLNKDLDGLERLEPFQAEKDLTAVAQGHAHKSGKDGSTGHQDFNIRFEALLGNPYMHVGENCSYGYETAIDVVLSLLIDEGIKDHGHRNNILSVDFNSIGVAIRPHKSYRINCVMDFGQRKRSSMNQVPY
jgi:uncharacterized protein YkwD